MSKRTQKAGATARFGARYGVSVRRNAGKALAQKKEVYLSSVSISKSKAAGCWNLEVWKMRSYFRWGCLGTLHKSKRS